VDGVLARRAHDAPGEPFSPEGGGQTGPATLFATTANGLQQSIDGCATWMNIPAQGLNPSGAHIRWIVPYPNNYDVLYAGMDGLGGLYRSTNAGNSWHGTQGLPPGGWVTSMLADPRFPAVMFVGLRYVGRDHLPAHIYRSIDGGLTWRSASRGMSLLPNNGGYVAGLAWSGDTLVAATSHDGLFTSADRGFSWQLANLPRRTTDDGRTTMDDRRPASELTQYASRIADRMPVSSLMATAEGVLLINTPEGAFQSADGTRTWQGFGTDVVKGGNLLMAMDSSTSTVLLASREEMWSHQIPAGIASLPTAEPIVAAQGPPTPPPPPPLHTATPTSTPTATPTHTPTPTPTIVLVQGPLPTDRAQPLDPAVSSYFPETGHNIAYGFRDYWLNRGGLAVFGYPLTEEFVENGVSVQYFERVRLEYRDGSIQWGLLGSELTQGQFFRTVPFFPSTDDRAYFGPTQHSVSGPFLEFWRDNGGLATFGYPLSESFKENDLEIQWFERARFEWHPELPPGKRIVLGTIGREALQRRGWIR
jgi:hypothetical protein